MAEQTKNDGSRDDDVFHVRLRFKDRNDALRFNSDYKFDVIDTSVDDNRRPAVTVLVTKK